MDKKFIKFLPKLFLFGSPFILLILSYFVFDPFNVIKNKKSYGSNYLAFINRNVIGTSTYKVYNDTYNFNSFIFGSSRSSAFLTKDWSPYINEKTPYHFDAFNDNISGIRKKIDFIKANGGQLKNVILVIDLDTFSEKFDEMESLPHLKDPRWNGGNKYFSKDWWAFQLTFFKAFFKDYFFLKFLDVKLFNTYRPWLEGTFNKYDSYYFTSPTNDFTFPMHAAEIRKDSIKYYQNKELFKEEKKEEILYEPFIKKHHLTDLEAIAKVFKSDSTDYKIVIGPTSNWNKYNPTDLEILYIYFKKANIYNYSGRNKYTENTSDYYDDSHYKPNIGRMIIEDIYK